MRNLIVTGAVALLLASVSLVAEPSSLPASRPATSTAPASKPADPKTATLGAAIGDFASLLEKNDKDTALERWAYGEQASSDILDGWDEIRKAHAKYDYRKWIDAAGAATEKYTVGGHDAGHLHVVWVKTDEGWRIDKILHCN